MARYSNPAAVVGCVPNPVIGKDILCNALPTSWVGRFVVSGLPNSASSNTNIEVHMKLSLHGTLSIASAQLVQEEEDDVKMDTDKQSKVYNIFCEIWNTGPN